MFVDIYFSSLPMHATISMLITLLGVMLLTKLDACKH